MKPYRSTTPRTAPLGSRTKAAEARKAENFDLIPFLKGNRLLVSSGLQGTPLYESLLDSLSGSNIYVSSRNSFDMMELIRSGKYDFPDLRNE